MANDAQRNVRFTVKVEADKSIGEVFNALESRVSELQRRMNLRIGATEDARRGSRFSTPAPPYQSPSGPNGNGYGPNGNGNGNYGPNGNYSSPAQQAADNQREQSERNSSRRIASIRRESDERMRIEAERSAKLVEKANRESLEQQVKDLRKAEEDRQRIADKQAAAEAKDLERRRRDANKQLAGLVRSGPQAVEQDERRSARERAQADRDAARLQRDAEKEEAAERRRIERDAAKVRRDAEAAERRNPTTGWAGLSAMGRDAGQRGTEHREGQQAWERGQQQMARDNERQRRAAETSLTHQREAYNRLGESIVGTTDAVTRLGEGMAYLGLIGRRDLGSLTDSLLAVRGTVETIRGTIGTLRDMGGLVRNLRDVRGIGGIGGIGRALIGVGPAPAGVGATGAISGAGLATAGIATAGVAALAAGGLHLATGGRSTRQFGRAVYRSGESVAQGGYESQRGWRTAFMDEGERANFNAQDLMQDEDVEAAPGQLANHSILRFLYSTLTGGGTGAIKNAARERNFQRRQGRFTRAQEIRQQHAELENLEAPAEFRDIELRREQEERTSSIRRNFRSVEFQHDFENTSGLRGEKRARQFIGERMSQLQRGLAGQMEASPMDALRSRRELDYLRVKDEQRAGKIEILTGKRERERGLDREQNELLTRKRTGIQAIADLQARNISETNSQGQLENQEKIKTLVNERFEIEQRLNELSERRRKGEIQDAAKLIQLTQERLKIATQRVQQTTGEKLSLQERLGKMMPMQLRAAANAMQAAKRGDELNRYQIEALEQGGPEMQEEAKRQWRKQFEKNVSMLPKGQREEFMRFAEENVENAEEEFAVAKKEFAAAQASAPVSAKGEVTVGGEYNITIDIRDDMQLAKELRDELSGIDEKLRGTEERVMKAVRAVVNDMAAGIHGARAVQSRGGGAG